MGATFWSLRRSTAILRCNRCAREKQWRGRWPYLFRDAADRKQFRLVREVHIMAVPKRRMSRSNTRSRRAQWKAEATGLVSVNVAGQAHKVPRRLLKAARLGLIDLDRRA